MDIGWLSLLQATGVLVLYSACVVLLPYLAAGRVLRRFSLSQQFLMAFTAGNCAIINIGYVLELLHISNRITLIALTAAVVLSIRTYVYEIDWKRWLGTVFDGLIRLAHGTLQLRMVLHDMRDALGRALGSLGRWAWGQVRHNLIDWAFILAYVASCYYVFGHMVMHCLGYMASDVPVHLAWINQLFENNLFSGGIYPMGYHVVIYYLSAVFGIPAYLILRLFYFVQDFYIFLMPFVVARCLCKSRFAYAGPIICMVLTGAFELAFDQRYFASLPEEFGMLFVYPCLYYAVRFFYWRHEEVQGGRLAPTLRQAHGPRGWVLGWRESQWCLAFFALAFGTLLAVHFYDAIAAGLMCLAVVVGFMGRFVRKGYFLSVVRTVALSLALALYPMLICFALGTPLQNSLRWGLDVINNDASTQTQESMQVQEDSTSVASASSRGGTDGARADSGSVTSVAASRAPEAEEPSPTTLQGLEGKVRKLYAALRSGITVTFAEDPGQLADALLASLGVLLLLGIAHQCFHDYQYGATLVASSLGVIFLLLLRQANSLGLPRLMDEVRTTYFLVYSFLLAIPLCVDAVVGILAFDRRGTLRSGLCLAFSCLMIAAQIQTGYTKVDKSDELQRLTQIMPNGNIIVASDILKSEEPFHWTIVSANIETEMYRYRGWHYEIGDLLKKIDAGESSYFTIPTDDVYFFVEKRATYYYSQLDGQYAKVSKEAAREPLPDISGQSAYKFRNRVIVMSKLYYWARRMQQLYPYDMTVCYETDDFICFRLHQNTYRLDDLGIDYLDYLDELS